MKRPSLRERILSYYRKNAGVWISGGELERIASSTTTYKPSTISRRARELAEENLLERKEEKGTVLYRYTPTTRTVQEVQVIGDRAVLINKEVIN